MIERTAPDSERGSGPGMPMVFLTGG